MGFDNLCNTTLVLSLSIQSNTLSTTTPQQPETQSSPKFNNINLFNNNISCSFEPSLTLGLSGGGGGAAATAAAAAGGGNSDLYRQASPNSAVSSFSNASVKRERDIGSEEADQIERGSAKIVDEDDDSFGTRKKLRLTKEQSALLEESFKDHSTLNPKQKQALARQLNLRPRQVEVWFQNRRARTKLKQTEVDCEFLKKCCETLTDENKRLHKELQELKALKLAQPFYMQIPAATLSMCPSCERITGTEGEAVSKTPMTPFAIAAAVKNRHHLYNPFSNPSAAC